MITSTIALLLVTACSSSTDAGAGDILWTRLAGNLSYAQERCPTTCTSSVFILDAGQQQQQLFKKLPGATFIGLAWSPDGRLTYAAPPDGVNLYQLYAIPSVGADPVLLHNPGGPAAWTGDGHVAYPCPDETLCVDDDELLNGATAEIFARPAWSPNGARLVVGMSDPVALSGLVAVSVPGKEMLLLRLNAPGTFAYNPLYSPNGQMIAFELAIANTSVSEIWVMSSDGSGSTRLSTGHSDREPAWSPDGREIAFLRDGHVSIMNADAGDLAQVTGDAATSLVCPESRPGRRAGT